MSEFLYFVSYAHKQGTGNSHIKRDRPITEFEQIQELEEFIAKENGRGPVALTNWILLSPSSKDT